MISDKIHALFMVINTQSNQIKQNMVVFFFFLKLPNKTVTHFLIILPSHQTINQCINTPYINHRITPFWQQESGNKNQPTRITGLHIFGLQ
jgi:hypothetical protein